MNRLRKKSEQSHSQFPQKIPKNKLSREVKDLYNENYKTLKKEI
jgi:hypothetical protein